MPESQNVLAMSEEVWLDDAEAVKQRPGRHAAAAEAGDFLLGGVEAAHADHIDEIARVIQCALERTFVADR